MGPSAVAAARSTHRRARRAPAPGSSALLALALGGCFAGGGGDGDGDGVRVVIDCEPDIAPCDIAATDCQQRVWEATACVRGQAPGTLPPIRSITQEVFAQELMDDMGAGMTSAWDTALRLLRVLPEAQPTSEVVAGELLVGVVAYYDDDTGEVTLVEEGVADAGEDAATLVLSHELSHVLQDRAQGLAALAAAFSDSTDERVALNHVIEGEAVVLSTIVSAHTVGGDERGIAWDGYFDQMLDGVLAGVDDSPVPFFTALQSLPYPAGGRAVSGLRARGGQALVERLYDEGPGVSVDYQGRSPIAGTGTLSEPLDCSPQLPPAGRTVGGLDSFGAAGLVGMLAQAGLPADTALRLSLDLRADLVAVFTDDDGSDRGVAVEMRLQLVDADAAAQVALQLDQLQGVVAQNDGRTARLVAAETEALRDGLLSRGDCGEPGALSAFAATLARGASLRLPALPGRPPPIAARWARR